MIGGEAVAEQIDELGLIQHLMRDLTDDLPGKLARSQRLIELSGALGAGGIFMQGGETAWIAWREARWSFIHGNFIATIQLCQGLMEHLLAGFLRVALLSEDLPPRISFSATMRRCLDVGILSDADAAALRRLTELRNPLSHFRSLDDASNLTRRVMEKLEFAEDQLYADAEFAIETAIQILALPPFRVDGQTEVFHHPEDSTPARE